MPGKRNLEGYPGGLPGGKEGSCAGPLPPTQGSFGSFVHCLEGGKLIFIAKAFESKDVEVGGKGGGGVQRCCRPLI